VRTRVASISARDAVRSRDGVKAASDKFRPVKGSLSPPEPLDLIQIDHTLVDVIAVDELQRKPIGRPWLSLAIDVATRTIPGFFLSLNTPSAAATAMLISRAVLPKESYLASLDLESEWPMHGIPRMLHLDNAKEFHSRALVRGCEQHGIGMVYRPPRRPHFGGHIERLIGTLMGEVHLLPGTTFSSVAKRGAYNSATQAMMTLQEIETWLAWQITAVYHLRRHSSLRRAPLDAWREGVQSMTKTLRDPGDPKRFYIDFLPYKTRSIGRQ
jgi:putative transposase